MNNFLTGKFNLMPGAHEGVGHYEYEQRAEKIMQRVQELAGISEDKTGITRTFGTEAFITGCSKVQSWMKLAGLQSTIDNIGNVRGRYNCGVPNAKTLVIASHIDTVVNAGKYDGPLGVIMAIDAVEKIVANKIQLPFNIEVIAFSDEEGVRFHTTYLGSTVVAGSFNSSLLTMHDEKGNSLKQVIEAMGGNTNMLPDDAIRKDEWLGYLEIHIEQGPVLYEKKIPVAVVTDIAGQQRAEITFKGVAGHAGTVPMDMRTDALCAAAAFIVETEKYALAHKDDVVATVGKLNILSPASNVIPGTVICSVDLRSANESILTSAHQAIKDICSNICSNRKIAFDWKPIQSMLPVACDKKMALLMKQAIVQGGYEVVELVSGAGHDAVPVAAVAPVCMMFVRCFKGISHNPLEDVETADVAAAVQVTDNFIQQLSVA